MTLEERMRESLTGDSPGDERLMKQCAEIVDGSLPVGYPRLASVMWPIQYFMEGMLDGDLEDDFTYLHDFLVDLAKAADTLQQERAALATPS